MRPVYFHIDVNSAFLSWSAVEKLKEPNAIDLRLVPSIIGGDIERRHGVVLAKSVPAKAFHITTGEPIVSAYRKCPNLVMEPPNHPLYEQYSSRLMAFLYKICPDIEKLSIDECFMDFTPIAMNYSSPIDAANEIREKIYETFGFTVNIGISDKKVLAKMASDFKKPNLVHTLFTEEIPQKMWPLPVSALFMCGKSSTETLRKLEILTIGDLAQADLSILEAHLKSHGKLLWEYANGIDDSMIISNHSELKGIGNSITLSQDVTTTEEAQKVLLHLSETVAGRLRKDGRLAGMVSTEIKFNNFQSISHQLTLTTPSDSTDVIYQNACRLFDEMWDHTPIRLLGIRTSKLVSRDEPVQLNLFEMETPLTRKQQKLDSAIDQIRSKFGNSAITRGSLLGTKEQYKKH